LIDESPSNKKGVKNILRFEIKMK